MLSPFIINVLIHSSKLRLIWCPLIEYNDFAKNISLSKLILDWIGIFIELILCVFSYVFTKNSFKYGVWYTEYQNEEDFDKPSAEIRYKLSDPIPNDTGEGEIKNKLYGFIKDAIKINN